MPYTTWHGKGCSDAIGVVILLLVILFVILLKLEGCW